MKIFKSLISIFAVAAIAVGATGAYFTDEVRIDNNVLETGTIDIIVDENINDVRDSFMLEDMKPGFIQNTDFVVTNTGSNPANIYKQVDARVDEAGLASVIDYSLSVVIPGVSSDWNQSLYNYNKTVAKIQGKPMFLGMLPVGASMNVSESYRMKTTAGDEYQGKTMTFDIKVTAEQLKGTLVLENKNVTTPDWQILSGDGVKGTLNYGVMDKKFNYSFSAKGLVSGAGYTLVMGDDYPFANGVIAQGTSDSSGSIALAGSEDFAMNKINQKVWLILTSDWNGTNIAGWNPSSYLFETGLIDYYDSGL